MWGLARLRVDDQPVRETLFPLAARADHDGSLLFIAAWLTFSVLDTLRHCISATASKGMAVCSALSQDQRWGHGRSMDYF